VGGSEAPGPPGRVAPEETGYSRDARTHERRTKEAVGGPDAPCANHRGGEEVVGGSEAAGSAGRVVTEDTRDSGGARADERRLEESAG
jgi:hypothetical protein